jgi:hypothetical protein
MDVAATKRADRATQAEIVINVGAAFVNMSVLAACIETGAAYIDTAIHEDPAKICETPPWYANYEWKRARPAQRAGVTAMLGAGFDPGVVNAYAASSRWTTGVRPDRVDRHHRHQRRQPRPLLRHQLRPEINFPRVHLDRSGPGRTVPVDRPTRCSSTARSGTCRWSASAVAYLTGHDELHSLSQTLGVPDIRFWMGFSDHYIKVFTVLNKLGLLSEQPVRTARGPAGGAAGR